MGGWVEQNTYNYYKLPQDLSDFEIIVNGSNANSFLDISVYNEFCQAIQTIAINQTSIGWSYSAGQSQIPTYVDVLPSSTNSSSSTAYNIMIETQWGISSSQVVTYNCHMIKIELKDILELNPRYMT